MKLLMNNQEKMEKNSYIEILKKNYRLIVMSFVSLLVLGLQSCEDSFLDVVPDNVSTIEHAFKLRNEAEKYLFTCYSYLPKNGDVQGNIGMLAGDEAWIPPQDKSFISYAFKIAEGSQRSFDTYVDAWEGKYHGAGPGSSDRYPLFDGIRTCNTLIDNLEDRNKVPDMEDAERLRWIAEGKFLKAYYHYYLMRMYGPIPIMKKNIPIDAGVDELYVSREPIDDVVAYVVQLLDEASLHLPTAITDVLNESGRATATMSKSLKAEVLLTAASPLFNGNSDMAGFKTKSGTPFFNPTYSVEKWGLAATAAKEAIDEADLGGNKLYNFTDPTATFPISDITRTKLSISQALSDRKSPEVIWSNTNSTTADLQRICMVPLLSSILAHQARKSLAATLKTALLFYSKNGVPIEEDNTLDFTNISDLRTATASEKFNIFEGYKTARINFDREPRFYADLGFDGSVYYLENSGANETKWHVEGKLTQYSGNQDFLNYNVTGYYVKKLVSYRYVPDPNTDYNNIRYAWPEKRLAELYLDYAEALNESQGPQDDVFIYLDKIRTRAGLAGVKESWATFSKNPTKFDTKEGLRQIIHQERNIELAFEGKRYWDLRRWKKASNELNQPVKGWSYLGDTNESYYQIRTIHQQRFVAPRDYFWPINQSTIRQNPNLIQNPGW
jgi:starch-binding outer membrane protein, SusD/RagB family